MKINIEIGEDNLIKVKQEENNKTSIKYITFDKLAELIISTKNNKEDTSIYETPLLPANKNTYTIQYKQLSSGAEIYYIVKEKCNIDITYFDTIYKNVGIPKLIFAVKVYEEVIRDVYTVAVKDKVIHEDTALYHYPFSNVSTGNGHICFGSNKISSIKITSPIMLHSIPDMFLSMPNNNDNYGNNTSNMEYRMLLESLQDKEFNDDYLMCMNKTYKEWFQKIN